MYGRPNETGFITGGKGGLVIKWSTYGGGMVNETQYDLKSKDCKSLNPRVKSVCEHPNKGIILVGSRGGEIYEFNNKKTAVVLKSHFDKEVCGLASHPTKEEFLTVG